MATHTDDTDLRHCPADRPDADAGFGSEFDEPQAPGLSPPHFGRLALCVAAAAALASGVMGTVAYSVWFNHDQQAYAEAIAGAREALGSSGGAAPQTAPAATTAAAAALGQLATLASPGAAVPSDVPPVTAAAVIAAPTPTPPADHDAVAQTTPGEEGTEQAIWAGQVRQSPSVATPPVTLADIQADSSSSAASTDPSPASRSPQQATQHAAANPATPAAQQTVSARPAREAHLAQERRATASNAKHRSNLFARVSQFFRRASYRQHDSGRQQQDLYSHP